MIVVLHRSDFVTMIQEGFSILVFLIARSAPSRKLMRSLQSTGHGGRSGSN